MYDETASYLLIHEVCFPFSQPKKQMGLALLNLEVLVLVTLDRDWEGEASRQRHTIIGPCQSPGAGQLEVTVV